jgi:cardiolipin synthase
MRLSELRALPNLLSISRLALAAGFVAIDRADARIVLVMLAMATDYFDGFVARQFGPMTRFGALLDPFADRVFVLVGVSVFLFDGQLTMLQYFVMISRDLMTAIGFVVAKAWPALRGAVFQARFSGKLVTVLQLTTFVAILIRPAAATPMIWVVAATSLWSIIDYTWALNQARER